MAPPSGSTYVDILVPEMLWLHNSPSSDSVRVSSGGSYRGGERRSSESCSFDIPTLEALAPRDGSIFSRHEEGKIDAEVS